MAARGARLRTEALARQLRRDVAGSWSKDGVIFPLRILSIDEAKDTLSSLRAFETTLGRRLQGNLRFNTHLLQRFVFDIAARVASTYPLDELLGPDVLLWSSDWVEKRPGSKGFFTLHQDSTYMGLDPPEDCVSVWLALTDSSPHNGCLHFVKGSHVAGQLPHKEMTDKGDNLLSRGQTVLDSAAFPNPEPVVLLPGEASVHSPFALHCSGPNRSRETRVGLVLRFVKESTRPIRPMCAVRVRGATKGPCNFELIDPADTDSTAGIREATWRRWQRAMNLENAQIFDGATESEYES